MRIIDSARKHGVTDEDIVHALRMAIWTWPSIENLTMRVGPGTTGQLLEIGVLDIDGDDPVIVHAMRCRARLLPPR